MNLKVIEFSDTVKDYGSKKIGPVDFSIGRGEIFGFLGPNGSGKTTCIRLLLGLSKPTSGRVRLQGLDPLAKHIEALRGVGYSPELPNIQSFLTPKELLELTAAELGLTEPNSEVMRILETVGLIEYEGVKVGKLSKGMVQRLSVAQAMLGSPKVLVLDEPMIGLDPAGTAHLREVFRMFASEGGTILMSSHMMNEVEDLCSSIGLIHGGRLLFNGSIRDMVGQVLGVEEVRVEALGLTDEIVRAVTGVAGVISVKLVDRGLEAVVEKAKEVRPEIAKIVIEAGAELLAIGEKERRLERAYIEALRNDGHQAE